MLSCEVIICASDSFSHSKRKIVDYGNCTWEMVKAQNSVSELNLVTSHAILNELNIDGRRR